MNNDITSTTILQSPAEKKALDLIRQSGYQYPQQLDWVAFKDGQWTIFEVKERELFSPGANYPDFGTGTGLDLKQIRLRSQLLKLLGLRTYLLVFEKGIENVYGEFLDVLESKGGYLDTKNDIRIYPIESFVKITPHSTINVEVIKSTARMISRSTVYQWSVLNAINRFNAGNLNRK